MKIVLIMFEQLRFMGELLAAELILTLPSIKRRANFKRNSIVGFVSLMLFTSFYLLLTRLYTIIPYKNLSSAIDISWYYILTLLSGVYLYKCFKLNITETLWFLILAYSIQHIVYVLIHEIVFMGFGKELAKNFGAYVSISISSCVLLYVLFYRIFAPYLRRYDCLNMDGHLKTRLVYLALFFMLLGSFFVNQSNAVPEGSDELNYLGAVSDLFNCFLVAGVLYGNLRANMVTLEKATTVQLYEQTVKQYKAFQKAVDYVNIKCHDLKYQIQSLEKEGRLNTETFNEIMDNIAIYRSFVKTGSETLDVILTDYFLYCHEKNIGFSYMANAEGFDKLERRDIYSLFCNMLDNAVEHSKSYIDAQKRFIRLSVKSAGKMLIIHIENYFEGDLVFQNGLPKTTKQDKNEHGFGLLSIKSIATKYNGSLRITANDNLFRLDIILQP